MMQDLRKNTKFVMIIVALAFVGLMVFEWGMDITGQSAALQTGELGRVNGEPVQYQDYTVVYQEMQQQAQQEAGGQLSRDQTREIEDAAFNQVVNDILIRQEMERRDIHVTEEEIRLAAQWSPHPDLMQQEIFMTDGQFDISKYQQFLSSPRATEDFLLGLEQYYRSAIPRSKLMRQVQAGIHVSDAELWQLWLDRNQTVTVDYVELDLATLVPGDVEVTDREIRAYYDENEEQFRQAASARMTIGMVLLGLTAADSAAALSKARELRQAILEGADFAEVAQRESADPGSAQNGGQLGTFQRGQMVDPFDEAAFSLPVGEISEPVLTQFGYHLIRVDAREDDQVTASHILIPIEPTEESLDQSYARADSLEMLAERGGVERAATALGGEVVENVRVSLDQSFVPGIGSVAEAIEWARDERTAVAADPEVDEIETLSPVFESEQAFYVAEIEEYREPGIQPLSEATPAIRRQLILEKKQARARELGQEIVAAVRGGEMSLEEAAAEHGLDVGSTGPFTRMGMNPVLGQANEAVGAAFGTPVGQVSDVVTGGSGMYIVKPTEQSEPDRAAFEAEKEQLRSMAQYQLQQERLGRWLQSLRDRANIVDRRTDILLRS